jgi:hypothetical protein
MSSTGEGDGRLRTAIGIVWKFQFLDFLKSAPGFLRDPAMAVAGRRKRRPAANFFARRSSNIHSSNKKPGR